MEILKSLLSLDVKSLMGVLIWSNLALAVLSFCYNKFHYSNSERKQIMRLGLAKCVQAIAWLLLVLGNHKPNNLPIYIGFCLLFISIYLESITMLKTIEGAKRKWYKTQHIMLPVVIILSLLFKIFSRKYMNYIAIPSIGVFALMLGPTLIYISDKKSTTYKKYLGTNMLVILCVIVVGGLQSLLSFVSSDLTNRVFQSMTFLALILLILMNSSGFFLLMYETTDKLIKSIANLDPLTQICNRRYFMEKAASYFERYTRAKKSLAILFVDIDQLKEINDQYGQFVGDEILVDLGKVLMNCIRPTDLCGRYGGEEFVVLLHDSDERQADMVASRIRRKIKSVLCNGGVLVDYTVSIGVYSNIPNEEITLEKFIGLSSKTLNQSKEMIGA